MISWPICVLILGLAFIAVLWDVGRRIAAAKGVAAHIRSELARQDESVDEALADAERKLDARMKIQSEAIDTAKRGVDAYVKQTTDQIQALSAGLSVRSMRG